MLQSKLHIHDQIGVDNILVAVGPGADTGAAARLVGIFATSIEFAVSILGDIEIMISKFRALVVVAVGVGDHFLESGHVDLVRDGLSIDWVAYGGVLDFEDAIDVRVEI